MGNLTLQEGVAVGGGLGVSAGHEGGGSNERLGKHFGESYKKCEIKRMCV